MNRRKGHKLLGSLIFAIALLISTTSAAYGVWWGGWRPGWHYHYYGGAWVSPQPSVRVIVGPRPIFYRSCQWIPGHWEYRYWVPAHRVCWH